MITSIEVDGFRSLIKFKMSLFPGLNILVGPNGSGKTNIITFFEFLSNLVSDGSSEAVNQLGGAGSVFTKTGEKEYQKQIAIKITGCTNSIEKDFLQYRYSILIEASDNFDSIKFKNQIIELLRVKKFAVPETGFNNAFRIIQDSTISSNRNNKHEIQNYNQSMVDLHFLPIKLRKKIAGDRSAIIEILDAIYQEDVPLTASLSLFVGEMRKVISDLRGGKILNIIPTKVKIPEKTSGTIGINTDGSGIAATLYAIQNKINIRHEYKLSDINIGIIFRRAESQSNYQDASMTDVLKYIKTAYPAINKIEVTIDRFDNVFQLRFWIGKEGEQVVLPLSSLSDGTIKWLSLITAILTTPSILSIEEPENYLHPHMQSEAIKMMRESTELEKTKGSVLISTHSETIINNAVPSELVIVSFGNGKTKAQRCENQTEIAEEISKTGFGLGYYYISGSVNND